MDYSGQVLHDSNIFTDPSFINLKLKSPSPSPFNDHSIRTHNNDFIPTSPIKSYKENSLIIEDEIVKSDHLKLISRFEIYKRLLSKVMGKDRLAKILYYLLNLLKYYLISTRRYLIDEKFTNLSINPKNHLNEPLKYFKLLVFLNSNLLEKKIGILLNNLSIFRFALRFGGTPYRVHSFYHKVRSFLELKNFSTEQFKKSFVNESFLSDLINLYYGITDELFLLFKLQILTNLRLRKFVGRHIDLAWLYDVLFGLKQNFTLLSDNRTKQLQLNIQYQVKQRASQLSKNLLDNINGNDKVGNSPLRSQILREFNNKSPAINNFDEKLNDLKHEENIIKLDLARLSFDLIQVSIDVWGLKFHPTVYSYSGLISGILGFSKIWIQTEKELRD